MLSAGKYFAQTLIPVREGPGLDFAHTGDIEEGSSVTVHEQAGAWARVTFEQKTSRWLMWQDTRGEPVLVAKATLRKKRDQYLTVGSTGAHGPAYGGDGYAAAGGKYGGYSGYGPMGEAYGGDNYDAASSKFAGVPNPMYVGMHPWPKRILTEHCEHRRRVLCASLALAVPGVRRSSTRCHAGKCRAACATRGAHAGTHAFVVQAPRRHSQRRVRRRQLRRRGAGDRCWQCAQRAHHGCWRCFARLNRPCTASTPTRTPWTHVWGYPDPDPYSPF